MASSLCASFSNLRVSRPQLTFKSNVACTQQLVVFTVEAKQNSLKRQRTAETARVYNKSRKSEIATRMKKVFTALSAYKATPPASEADLASVQTLINEAYQVIDKAVCKGVLHKNTGARRKARLAAARRNVLVAAGLYTPA